MVTKFLLPEKKPITYKTIASKEAQESKVLSKKDYSYAKEVFFNINEKKWTSVSRITKKVKNTKEMAQKLMRALFGSYFEFWKF